MYTPVVLHSWEDSRSGAHVDDAGRGDHLLSGVHPGVLYGRADLQQGPLVRVAGRQVHRDAVADAAHRERHAVLAVVRHLGHTAERGGVVGQCYLSHTAGSVTSVTVWWWWWWWWRCYLHHTAEQGGVGLPLSRCRGGYLCDGGFGQGGYLCDRAMGSESDATFVTLRWVWLDAVE